MNRVPPLPPFRRRHKGYGGQVGHPLLRPNAEERDGERSVLLRFMGREHERPSAIAIAPFNAPPRLQLTFNGRLSEWLLNSGAYRH